MPTPAKPKKQRPSKPRGKTATPIHKAKASCKSQQAVNVREQEKYAWRAVYLETLEKTGGKYMDAVKAAGIDQSTVWRHRQVDPEFAKAEEDAFQKGTRVLIQAAVTRAVDGVRETRYDKDGNVTSERTVYSDTLLIKLLERNDPSFRTRQSLDLNHSGGTQNTQVFMTRAELLAAKEKAKQEIAEQQARDAS